MSAADFLFLWVFSLCSIGFILLLESAFRFSHPPGLHWGRSFATITSSHPQRSHPLLTTSAARWRSVRWLTLTTPGDRVRRHGHPLGSARVWVCVWAQWGLGAGPCSAVMRDANALPCSWSHTRCTHASNLGCRTPVHVHVIHIDYLCNAGGMRWGCTLSPPSALRQLSRGGQQDTVGAVESVCRGCPPVKWCKRRRSRSWLVACKRMLATHTRQLTRRCLPSKRVSPLGCLATHTLVGGDTYGCGRRCGLRTYWSSVEAFAPRLPLPVDCLPSLLFVFLSGVLRMNVGKSGWLEMVRGRANVETHGTSACARGQATAQMCVALLLLSQHTTLT